jgi:hypothetical protein
MTDRDTLIADAEEFLLFHHDPDDWPAAERVIQSLLTLVREDGPREQKKDEEPLSRADPQPAGEHGDPRVSLNQPASAPVNPTAQRIADEMREMLRAQAPQAMIELSDRCKQLEAYARHKAYCGFGRPMIPTLCPECEHPLRVNRDQSAVFCEGNAHYSIPFFAVRDMPIDPQCTCGLGQLLNRADGPRHEPVQTAEEKDHAR